MTKYFVLNGHTLVYRIEGAPEWHVGILAHRILLGSPFDRLAGWTIVWGWDRLRPATLDDFAAFRVSPKGHLT